MKNIAFLFPGQGSQYIGMGKELHQEFNIVKETFDEANEVLGYDLRKICFEGSLRTLNDPENMLPAILTVSVSSYRAYMEMVGEEASFMAGHSLGEYSALTCSGAISFADALKLVHLRSSLAKQVKNGIMSVISGVNRQDVLSVCKEQGEREEIVAIACWNGPDQFVISGHEDAIARAEDQLALLNAQSTPILMTPPFHSPLMSIVVSQLKEELEKYSFENFRVPVIANVTALPYKDTQDVINNLTLQLTKTVRWSETIAFLQEQGIEKTIEMGPKAVLTDLMRSHSPIISLSYGQKDHRQTIVETLKSNQPGNVSTVVTRSLAVAVATRNKNFDSEQYRIGVEEPYEKIEKLQAELEEKGLYPTVEQMKVVLSCLSLIMKTKGASEDEQLRRFRQILSDTGTSKLLSEFPFCKENQ
ncbi:[acyl-carrier-protein] S-malonyltransferase [Paenibacillus sp. CF095]|uniref:ACP S-malonyltransferase n=1 Tax=Paenibacillus sp. CF095 TaxID=1881033 RepID=UPI00088B56B2|nr:ACP S-malonyltransferase [Paenibacillus sp. CF095]SDD50681.1 [acyl-carrier-protein] S-malonyltransferase [Paenibacillus sp. CF095]